LAVVVLNGGSSSWKIALYPDLAPHAAPGQAARCEVALSWPTASDPEDARLAVTLPGSPSPDPPERTLRTGRGRSAIAAACDAMRAAGADLDDLRAAGHRIVHGGARFTDSVVIDDAVERQLLELAPLAPSHNAVEASGIDAVRALFPRLPQVAAFDTAFHRTLPPAAFTYPGPYAWRERGIRRYGFHGLSVAYCIERTAQLLGRERDAFDAIVAHLGGGCSVTAVRAGASVDTSMGFTPLDGTMMGTRSGAVDPGILTYLAREHGARGANASDVAANLDDALNRHSGLLGISGISGDVRAVIAAAEAGDERAELALEMFAHRCAVTIAGMATSLASLDALVFTGGIGTNAAAVRERICGKLAMLGVRLDARKNAAASGRDARIDAGGPTIYALETNEEWYVARECARALVRA
jgi:acetate kinase